MEWKIILVVKEWRKVNTSTIPVIFYFQDRNKLQIVTSQIPYDVSLVLIT